MRVRNKWVRIFSILSVFPLLMSNSKDQPETEVLSSYVFTPDNKEQFDKVAEGKKVWNKMIGDFYKPFHKAVETTTDLCHRSELTHTYNQRFSGYRVCSE